MGKAFSGKTENVLIVVAGVLLFLYLGPYHLIMTFFSAVNKGHAYDLAMDYNAVMQSAHNWKNIFMKNGMKLSSISCPVSTEGRTFKILVYLEEKPKGKNVHVPDELRDFIISHRSMTGRRVVKLKFLIQPPKEKATIQPDDMECVYEEHFFQWRYFHPFPD